MGGIISGRVCTRDEHLGEIDSPLGNRGQVTSSAQHGAEESLIEDCGQGI